MDSELGSESYGGTRGHSGGDASRDAAYADLAKGITSKVQRLVLILAAQAGERGITVADVREKNGTLHHGRVSSALTKMHIAGKLAALTERRGHQGIYVLPEHVGERDTRAYQRQRVRVTDEMVDAAGRVMYERWDDWSGGDAPSARGHVGLVRDALEAALAVRP